MAKQTQQHLLRESRCFRGTSGLGLVELSVESRVSILGGTGEDWGAYTGRAMTSTYMEMSGYSKIRKFYRTSKLCQNNFSEQDCQIAKAKGAD